MSSYAQIHKSVRNGRENGTRAGFQGRMYIRDRTPGLQSLHLISPLWYIQGIVDVKEFGTEIIIGFQYIEEIKNLFDKVLT